MTFTIVHYRLFVYIYIYIYMYTYLYIYIYIERDVYSLTDQGLVLSSYAVGFHQALEFGLNMFKPWS